MKASGEFKVDLKPLEGYVQASEDINIGRMSIDKKFSGGLNATSKGEMLSAVTAVKESAGYVAIEQVNGNLEGKNGSFVLQHFGIMDQGQTQNRHIVAVVPDSGTGELTGLSGKMSIETKDGKHFYEFEYELGK